MDRPEVAEVADLVRRTMEGAAELSVPLRVEVDAGDNWEEVMPVPEEMAAAIVT